MVWGTLNFWKLESKINELDTPWCIVIMLSRDDRISSIDWRRGFVASLFMHHYHLHKFSDHTQACTFNKPAWPFCLVDVSRRVLQSDFLTNIFIARRFITNIFTYRYTSPRKILVVTQQINYEWEKMNSLLSNCIKHCYHSAFLYYF